LPASAFGSSAPTMIQEVGFAADSPLEGAGFEPSVPRRGPMAPCSLIFCIREFSRFHLFRLSGGEVLRRNSGPIGGFEEGSFEGDRCPSKAAPQKNRQRHRHIRPSSPSSVGPVGRSRR